MAHEDRVRLWWAPASLAGKRRSAARERALIVAWTARLESQVELAYGRSRLSPGSYRLEVRPSERGRFELWVCEPKEPEEEKEEGGRGEEGTARMTSDDDSEGAEDRPLPRLRLPLRWRELDDDEQPEDGDTDRDPRELRVELHPVDKGKRLELRLRAGRTLASARFRSIAEPRSGREASGS